MHIKSFHIVLVCLMLAAALSAQTGNGTYSYLDAPVSARMAALGGTNVSIKNDELTDAFQNPALLDSATHKTLSFNYAAYLAKSMFGSAAYGHNYKDNYFGVGVQFFSYGKFDGADEYGYSTGTFSAQDLAFNLMYARRLNDFFTVGATFKPLCSFYEHYSSFGIAFDVGAHFQTRDQAFTAGLVFRNAGVQLKGLHDDEEGQAYRETVPFDIQLGIAGKFKHAPIRLFMTLHDLQKWDLSYEYTNHTTSSLDNSVKWKENNVKAADMLFRHAIFGVDILAGKNVWITAAYNHQRNRELAAEGFKTLSGFSAGVGFNIKHLHFGFAVAPYQKGNMAFHFTLNTHLDEFK